MNALHDLYVPRNLPDGAFIRTLFCTIAPSNVESRREEIINRQGKVNVTNKRRIIDFLSDGQWHKTKEIERATGAGRSTIWHMQRCGEIECDDKGSRNGKAWRLANAVAQRAPACGRSGAAESSTSG